MPTMTANGEYIYSISLLFRLFDVTHQFMDLNWRYSDVDYGQNIAEVNDDVENG